MDSGGRLKGRRDAMKKSSKAVDGTGRFQGVLIGRIMGVSKGRPHVLLADFPEEPVRTAATTVQLTSANVGEEVALSFDRGDPLKPIVLGRILRATVPPAKAAIPPTLTVDSIPVPLEITAERELTLRCGKASITLTREGKIILRGTYISSRSSGANRIKGGSVQIN
jgi:hypothetical protein